MIRIFFGGPGGSPPAPAQVPDIVARDRRELASLVDGGGTAPRALSDGERDILRAVAARLAREPEDRDLDVVASSALFRVFPGSPAATSGGPAAPTRANGETDARRRGTP